MQKIKPIMLIALLLSGLIIAIYSVNLETNAEITGASNLDLNWALIANGTAVKGYPNLAETVWQKNATLAPNGPYDKIGLHRLVQTGITPKGVVLMLPGTYLSGEGLTSNPPTDTFTKTENDSPAIYWANRDFDVYALDYRTHFVPTNLNSTQLGFMANWGYDQWMSDIKEAVNKIKEESGVNKIFIAGFSFGGRAVMYYSAQYWQEDIRGIILLDGGTNIKTTAPTNSYNLTAALKQVNDTKKWALEAPNLPSATGVPSGWLFQKQYAAQNPSAPAEYPPGTPLTPTTNPATGKPWANITEFSAYKMNGAGSNLSAGYMNVTVLSEAYADMDRYWPDRLNLEYNAINDWTNCPYVTYDFNEYYSEINLPIISFTSELFGLPRGNGAVVNTTNPDTRQTILVSYGHMDVLSGTYSARDVSEPIYQWLINRSLAASITQGNAATITTRSSITLNVSATGGPAPYTYQWYQDGTAIIGQILPQINIGWTYPGTHTIFCKVNDSVGTTATTSALTLTVNAAPTPTTQPTQTQPIPTQKPTATAAPTTQPSTTPAPTANPTEAPITTPTTSPDNTQANLTNALPYVIVTAVVIAVIGIAAFFTKKK